MKQLLGDGCDLPVSLKDPVIPAQEVALHLPAAEIHMVILGKQGKLLADGSHHLTADDDLKGGHQGQQLFPDEAHLPPGGGLADVDLVPQGEKGRLHRIPRLPLSIINVITVRPGE